MLIFEGITVKNGTTNQESGIWEDILKEKKMIENDKVTLIWKGNKIPCDDCKVIFKNKFGKEFTVEISRLIQVFNNNIWNNKKSVK